MNVMQISQLPRRMINVLETTYCSKLDFANVLKTTKKQLSKPQGTFCSS
jgi:hypothetical protein